MRVALLMNFVAPYRVPLLERLRELVGTLRVFISTPMENDRAWIPEWGTLDVVVQRNVTLYPTMTDLAGFIRPLQVHVPYDTIPRLLRYAPDVVISAELGARTLQAVLYKALRPRTKLLLWCFLSEHSERNWGLARRMLRRVILAAADGVMVNGESGARYVQRFGVADHLITRVNQPVDVARFAAAQRTRPAGACTRLLCVGMLNSRKGVLPFARRLMAWAVNNPRPAGSEPAEIWWLGDGDLRAELEALPWPPGLTPRFLGNVPYAEVPETYAQCDLLVFPTLLDEWGLVVNEAMAVGLPVLGSLYSQAVEELVIEGETGWVFDPQSEASVDAGIVRALGTSPAAMAAMREAVQARIARLTPETTAILIADAIYQLRESPQSSLKAPTRTGEALQ